MPRPEYTDFYLKNNKKIRLPYPQYLAYCEHCGWRGSNHDTDSGFCPICHRDAGGDVDKIVRKEKTSPPPHPYFVEPCTCQDAGKSTQEIVEAMLAADRLPAGPDTDELRALVTPRKPGRPAKTTGP